MIKNEIQIFLTAVMFFTRLPIPKNVPYNETFMNRCTKYLPLIGLMVGGIAALTYLCCYKLHLPLELAVLLSIAATVFATGAFHEDGFADVCDGFGGGYTADKILEIMKDSRIGTYAMVGTLLLLGTKFWSLLYIKPSIAPIVMLLGHSISRLTIVVYVRMYSYVRKNDNSKARPVAKHLSWGDFAFAVLCGAACLVLLPSAKFIFAVLAAFAAFLVFSLYIKKQIGGYTGDCLGASQQLAELAFYVTWLGIQNN